LVRVIIYFSGEHLLPRLKATPVITLALSLLGLLAGTAAIASTASAAPGTRADTPADTITVISATSDLATIGRLTVQANSTSPITSLTVHVINPDTQADVLDPAMTKLEADLIGNAFHNFWTVVTPITTAQLPVGAYDIVVDATDQGGTTVTGVQVAAPWQFKWIPVVTFTGRQAVDYGHPTGQLTGTVQLRSPGGDLSAYKGPISLSYDWASGPAAAQTDASGNFSVAIAPIYNHTQDPLVTVGVGIPSTATNVAGAGQIDFAQFPSPSKITVKSPISVTYGAKASLTGTVEYGSIVQGGLVPVNRPTALTVYKSTNHTGKPDVTGTTDANGNFAITLPASTGATWTAWVGGTDPAENLLDFSHVTVTENVTYNTVITSFKVAPGQHRSLTFAGCLGLPANVPGAPVPPASALKLQWSAGKSGPWHNLSTRISRGGPCGHNGARFSGKATAQISSAYYRADFPAIATTSSSHNGYHSSASNPVHVTVR
jgi:hypothetical protein